MYNIGHDTEKLRETVGKKSSDKAMSGVEILKRSQGIKASKLAKRKLLLINLIVLMMV